MTLPDFPVDPATLDLLAAALTPDRSTGRTSVGETLSLYSELAGSDTAAGVESDGVTVLRDAQYHEHDVIAALITEVRRLRQPRPRRAHYALDAAILAVLVLLDLAAFAALVWSVWHGASALLAR